MANLQVGYENPSPDLVRAVAWGCREMGYGFSAGGWPGSAAEPAGASCLGRATAENPYPISRHRWCRSCGLAKPAGPPFLEKKLRRGRPAAFADPPGSAFTLELGEAELRVVGERQRISSVSVPLFAARATGRPEPDPIEGIDDVRLLPSAELDAWIAEGRITDAFTLAACTMARARGMI